MGILKRKSADALCMTTHSGGVSWAGQIMGNGAHSDGVTAPKSHEMYGERANGWKQTSTL